MGSGIFFVFPEVCSNCLSDLAKKLHTAADPDQVLRHTASGSRCVNIVKLMN